MKRTAGFTLVELLVTLGIVALLTAMAVPSMRGLIENGHIRVASESLQNGLSLARADAVRLNTQVALVIAATGWTVQRSDNALQLHQGAGKESTQGLAIVYTPGGSTTVTFDSFGRVVNPNPDGTAPITQIDFASLNPAGLTGYKPLRIQMLASGVARLCDPALAGTEPRACL